MPGSRPLARRAEINADAASLVTTERRAVIEVVQRLKLHLLRHLLDRKRARYYALGGQLHAALAARGEAEEGTALWIVRDRAVCEITGSLLAVAEELRPLEVEIAKVNIGVANADCAAAIEAVQRLNTDLVEPPTGEVFYHTGFAGRPSGRNLVEAEMKRRAESGELEPSLVAEVKALAVWYAQTHPYPEWPPLQPGTMRNTLRGLYRELRSVGCTKLSAPP
jgi:hypothetical protein